jgi:hypothetical protein
LKFLFLISCLGKNSPVKLLPSHILPFCTLFEMQSLLGIGCPIFSPSNSFFPSLLWVAQVVIVHKYIFPNLAMSQIWKYKILSTFHIVGNCDDFLKNFYKKIFLGNFFKKKKMNIIYVFEKIVKIHHKRNNCFQMKVSWNSHKNKPVVYMY